MHMYPPKINTINVIINPIIIIILLYIHIILLLTLFKKLTLFTVSLIICNAHVSLKD